MWKSCMMAVMVPILLIGAAVLRAQTTPAPKAQQHRHAEDPKSSQQDHAHHFEEVNKHGDEAMGFSHMKSTHHFRMTPQGGLIEVQANDPKDTETRDQIRVHLQQIAKAFKAGDFSAPEHTHSRVPRGVAAMQRLKSEINYRYEELAGGGRVMITTQNSEAVSAVHEFFRFQIQDHRTGDPLEIEKK